MNYRKHYESLITRARYRYLLGYTERHHIVPRCLGGNDDPENLVDLTSEEHFLAHQLLVKIYPQHHGLSYALYLMTRSTERMIRNNKDYKWIRQRMVKANRQISKDRYKNNPELKNHLSNVVQKWWRDLDPVRYEEICRSRSSRQKGKNNSFYNKTHSGLSRTRMSAKRIEIFESMTDEDYKNHPQTVSVSVNGEIIHGLSRAARKYGIGPALMRYRCLSKSHKWKDWFYTE